MGQPLFTFHVRWRQCRKKGSTRKGLRSNGPHKSVSPPRRLFSLEEPLENVSQGRRRDRERERETPRFDVRLVVANAISVLLSSRWWEHASPTVVERTCTRCVRGQKERQTFLFHAFPSPVTNIQCHSQQMFLWKTIRESLVTCRDRKASQKAGPTATARTWPDKTRRTDADIGISRCQSFENNFRARITTHGIGSGRIEIPWNKFCANRVTRGIIVSRYIS